jgi:TolB-like protein
VRKIITPILLLVLGALSSFPARAQESRRDLKNRYAKIEVATFNVQRGIDLPDEYKRTMMADVIKDLKRINKFKEVIAEGEVSQRGDATTIQLVGTVIQYKRGNRGKRFIALGLAGDTKVVAHVRFIDKASGEVLVEADVDGQIYTGLLGGSPRGAPSGVGKDVAKIAKKVFF